jgi:mRNA-degrading endonuclease RelE of RelBE toxin-antitoxin system
MYEIKFQPNALDDLKSLRKFEQQQVLGSVETQLHQQPTVETRNRKRLRPNETAEWEPRVGQLRVFYNADEQQLIVRIEAVGLKVGNLLFIRGEKREL